jgi:5-methylcytosine-specific restriction protein A
MCLRMGRDTAANTVDHIIPHKNDMIIFWDEDNWESLCSHCHSGRKQHIEKTGYSPACDERGVPLDESHPWNKR